MSGLDQCSTFPMGTPWGGSGDKMIIAVEMHSGLSCSWVGKIAPK